MNKHNSQENSIYNNFRTPFILIFILHAIFFTLAIFFNGIYTSDSPEYLHTAENILSKGIIYNGPLQKAIDPILYSLRPPGYSIFISLSKIISSSDLFILVFQNIISILLLCIIYYKINSANLFKNHGWLFFVGLIFFPIYLILINMVLAEGLLAFTLIASWLSLDKFVKSKRWYFLLLFNISLSIAVMVKPVMMYFWIPNLVLSGILFWRINKIYPIVFALIMSITIGLWSYRNYDKTGYFHFSSIKMQNLLEINAGKIVSYQFDVETKMKVINDTKTKAKLHSNFKEKSEYLLDEAKKIILDNPILYIKLHARGMINFMLAPGKLDLEDFFQLHPENEVSLLYQIEKKGLFTGTRYYIDNVNIVLFLTVIMIGIWNIFSLIFVLAAFLSKKIDLTLRIFLFTLLLYIIFACGPGGFARFKTAIYPIMLYLIPFGYYVIHKKVSSITNRAKK